MIKTLRITGVITAAFAIAFFIFIVIFGDRKDQGIKEFLNSPDVREKFENDAKNRVKTEGDRVSPLVKQAEAYALYLNPPKEKLPKSTFLNGKNTRPRMTTATPKFTVLATSFCEFNPEISLALIDEPGKGRHWVRQSEKVGYLIIEQVKDGLIIVKNDQETFEIPLKKAAAAGISKGSSVVGGASSINKPAKANVSVLDKNVQSLRSRMPKAPRFRNDDSDLDTKKEELVERLKSLKETLDSDGNSVEDNDTEKAEAMNELISKFKSSRITDEEAEKLDDLGEDLKDVQDEPNQTESNTQKIKLGTGKLIPR
jgi:hypothetical protein